MGNKVPPSVVRDVVCNKNRLCQEHLQRNFCAQLPVHLPHPHSILFVPHDQRYMHPSDGMFLFPSNCPDYRTVQQYLKEFFQQVASMKPCPRGTIKPGDTERLIESATSFWSGPVFDPPVPHNF